MANNPLDKQNQDIKTRNYIEGNVSGGNFAGRDIISNFYHYSVSKKILIVVAVLFIILIAALIVWRGNSITQTVKGDNKSPAIISNGGSINIHYAAPPATSKQPEAAKPIEKKQQQQIGTVSGKGNVIQNGENNQRGRMGRTQGNPSLTRVCDGFR